MLVDLAQDLVLMAWQDQVLVMVEVSLRSNMDLIY
jgi:hypothetical protein